MLGFATSYERNPEDAQLASIATREKRLLITRDVGLLKRNEVERGHWVRASAARPTAGDLRSVWTLFADATVHPLHGLHGDLSPLAKNEVADRLPLRVRETPIEFRRRENSGHVFRPGSHYARMRAGSKN
jgi:hypothetical protein